MKRSLRIVPFAALCVWVWAVAPLAAQAPQTSAPAAVSPLDAFARLKTLVGEWQGEGSNKGQAMPVHVSYKLTGAGSTVVETLFPGTPHEMMTMYHLNGPAQLMLTHYCSAGNQPSMVLDPSSTPDRLVFVFSSGTNMDPARSPHMHNARVRFIDTDHIESEWDMFQDGKLVETKKFVLAREK